MHKPAHKTDYQKVPGPIVEKKSFPAPNGFSDSPGFNKAEKAESQEKPKTDDQDDA